MADAPVLITGAGGCIGAWVLRRLRDCGREAVAFDLSADRRRFALLCDSPAEADSVIWETGDIADFARVHEIFLQYRPAAVIHLAALQVPFCAADPMLGARVNVAGSVNIFEAARQSGVTKIAYASSVAAAAMGAESPWKQTLYGAYKICNEETARVYWRDYGVASIGVRPSVVYGPARDQGMSAAPTLAMMAAALGRPYTIPFCGAAGFVHAGEAAAAFIRAADAAGEDAKVFNLNGVEKTVAETAALILSHCPRADINITGAPLPFPSDADDAPLRAHIGEYWRPDFEEGVRTALDFFARRAAEGRIHFPEDNK